MNDNSRKHWRQPLAGKYKWLGWFVILAFVLFVAVFGRALLANEPGSAGSLAVSAVIISTVTTLFLLGLLRFVRWLCCWRHLRLFLFGVACVITLIALFYAEEDWRGKRAWDQHRREWEAKGEKFSVVELAPPPVPDEKNFALAPLLKSALDFVRTTNGIVWRDTNAYQHLISVRADAAGGGEKKKLSLGNWETGALANLAACREFYRGNTNYPQPTAPGSPAKDILIALGKFDADLTGLQTAAAERPDARFPIAYDYEPAAGILLPHLGVIRPLCQLLHLRATAELASDQSGKAFEDLKLAFRLSDAIRDEPILVDHLVRIATLGVNLQTIREGLARHAWSEAQLTELETYLASINLLAEYKRAMRGERAFSTADLDFARRQGSRFNPAELFPPGLRPSSMVSLMPSGWFYQNMLTLSQLHQNYVLPAVDEKSHRVLPDYVQQLEAATEALGSERYHPYKLFAALLFPSLSKAIQKTARMQTYVDAGQVACALERYRLANGKYPDSLAALQPAFIQRIPNDVMDGKPLRYRVTPEGGYILYSVGWNLTDDGGELAWTSDQERQVDATKGDWVWTNPRTEVGSE